MRFAKSGRALALAGLTFLVGMDAATAATAEAVRLTASHQQLTTTSSNSEGANNRDTRDGVDQECNARRGSTERVSVDCAGNQGNGNSWSPAISAKGRFVAFASRADNLVPDDTNNSADIFVHDRKTGATERVSVDSAGNQGNGDSLGPAISADGRFVAFASRADNLVPGDTNNTQGADIFVHDRKTGATERVSVDSAGNQGNGDSLGPAISADGRFVAFESGADNLVPGDTNNTDLFMSTGADIFVHDRKTGATERVSVDSAGNQGNGDSLGPAISADGRFVAFESWADNLVPGDTNNTDLFPSTGVDIFVHDRKTGATERVSVDSAGNQGNGDSLGPAISANGRFVAFASRADNLVPGDTNTGLVTSADIFVHDRKTGATERVSVDSAGNQGNNNSWSPAISAKGRFVAFQSSAFQSSAAPGDIENPWIDTFVHDRKTGVTERVSANSAGNQSRGYSLGPAISAKGRFVAFYTVYCESARECAGNDRPSDIFVHDRKARVADQGGDLAGE